MINLRWLDTHIGSLDDAIQKINQLEWCLALEHAERVWFVRSGEKVIYQTDSREAVEAFLYGMALAYSILPDDLIRDFRAQLDL